LNLGDLLFEHHILSLQMDQDNVILKDTVDGLDDERRTFLKRRGQLHEKGVEEVHPPSLFDPQGHQD
jgi:hypothetical protein